MPAPEHILQKIKLLRNLANSPNGNEGQVAKTLADKLIEKYGVSDEELNSIADKPDPFDDEVKLFETTYIVSWMVQLALAICHKYDCQIVQEIISPVSEGDSHYNYFVYGDLTDVEIAKFVWRAFSKKVEELILSGCYGHGPIYLQSYSEGIVHAIKMNLQFEDFNLPNIKKDTVIKSEDIETKPDVLTPVSTERSSPTDNRQKVEGELIKDIAAYFHGIEAGKNLYLQGVIDAYHAQVKQQEQNGI